jgi:hypothetical protein
MVISDFSVARKVLKAIEHLSPEQKVAGSSPAWRTKLTSHKHLSELRMIARALVQAQADGEIG